MRALPRRLNKILLLRGSILLLLFDCNSVVFSTFRDSGSMSWDSPPCRSGSFEAGLRASSSSSVTLSSTPNPKPSPRFHRSRSTAGASKAPPSPEKRRGITGGGGAMPTPTPAQQRVAQLEEELKKERGDKDRVVQLEEELRSEREDKARAVEELDQLRRRDGGAEKARVLEREVERAKESERKMLESLIYQTKQLEQTKISLEEAKLEMAALQQSNRSLEARRGVMDQRSVKDLMFGGADDEIRALRGELRAAMQGEERSQKALDDLSLALSDVTMEAKQVKRWLSDTQAELEAANAEAARLRGELAAAETRLREQHRCRIEAEESAGAWGDKERVFLDCVRAAEEEVNLARQENTKLLESQRVIRDENARLRDILKQAVGEANIVKESLELARAENARLNDVVAEKESALQSLRQEYECIKVSEAAAQGSLKELNSLLAATTTTACGTPVSAATTAPAAPECGFDQQHLPNGRLVASAKGTPETASRRWMTEKPRTPGGRSYSIGEPGKFKGVGYSQSARMGSLNPKDRMFASLSNMADLKSAAADAAMDDYDDDDEFDHIAESHYVGMEHSMSGKKKRPILRKFGDLFRRKSFYKANLAPVHT
ncbi:WEB family protein At4g27595, chloroplastic-like isoform X1 [Triticum dicoccoides]|uniref:WEB family protein At4g27595, chloroplastic-like isoform X1 n=1 Tax=Triticum dicoccoides TaxID=85692 RepID=UPI00188FCDAD|nr:WEB family protein At4g27595, chloroplastic-like isoform X1 [Triticum dicoccoides]